MWQPRGRCVGAFLLVLLLLAPTVAASTRHDDFSRAPASDAALRAVADHVLNGTEGVLQALVKNDLQGAQAHLPRMREEVARLDVLRTLANVSSAQDAERYWALSDQLVNNTGRVTTRVGEAYAERDEKTLKEKVRRALQTLEETERVADQYDDEAFDTRELRALLEKLRFHLLALNIPKGTPPDRGFFFAEVLPNPVPVGDTVRIIGYALFPSGSPEEVDIFFKGQQVATARPNGNGTFTALYTIPLDPANIGRHPFRVETTAEGTLHKTPDIPINITRVPTSLRLAGTRGEYGLQAPISFTTFLESRQGGIPDKPVFLLNGEDPLIEGRAGGRGETAWRLRGYQDAGVYRVTLVFFGDVLYEGSTVTFTFNVGGPPPPGPLEQIIRAPVEVVKTLLDKGPAAAWQLLMSKASYVIAIVLALLLALLLAAFLLWRWLRRGAPAEAPAEAPPSGPGPSAPLEAAEGPVPSQPKGIVIHLYRALLRTFQRKGIDTVTRTPRELGRELVLRGADPGDVQEATYLFEVARYARAELEADAVTRFQGATDRIRQGVDA